MMIISILDALQKPFDTADHLLYLYKDEEVIFYVGQSINPLARLRQHLGYDRPYLPDQIGSVIRENFPASFQWQIELYTLEDCLEIVHTASPASFAFYQALLHQPEHQKYLMSLAEVAMIDYYRPILNDQFNNRNTATLPERYIKRNIANEGVNLE
jgi:hypothetical protein